MTIAAAASGVTGEMERAGRVARLPQQPLRILVELFDHAGEVVTETRNVANPCCRVSPPSVII